VGPADDFFASSFFFFSMEATSCFTEMPTLARMAPDWQGVRASRVRKKNMSARTGFRCERLLISQL